MLLYVRQRGALEAERQAAGDQRHAVGGARNPLVEKTGRVAESARQGESLTSDEAAEEIVDGKPRPMWRACPSCRSRSSPAATAI